MLGDSALIPVAGAKSLKPQGTIQAKQWRMDQKKLANCKHSLP
jgi:hypothetical protein